METYKGTFCDFLASRLHCAMNALLVALAVGSVVWACSQALRLPDPGGFEADSGPPAVSGHPWNLRCDNTLRSALLAKQGMGGLEAVGGTAGADVNSLIAGIQEQRPNDCSKDNWDPRVLTAPSFERCVPDDADGVFRIGVTEVPDTLVDPGMGGFANDERGNVLLAFQGSRPPGDGARCWLCFERYNYWDSEP